MKRISMVLLAALFIFVSLVPAGLVQAANKAVRVAIVKEWKGTATVTKTGGAKPLNVFNKMSINQGDTIVTGPKSRVVLHLVGGEEEDELTIGANANVSFTELENDGGAKTNIGVLAGSVWVKVKSIVGADDRFELETPTAVMAVRGTQFGVQVHPEVGSTKVSVTAGTVRVTYPVDQVPITMGVEPQVSKKTEDSRRSGDSQMISLAQTDVYPAQEVAIIPVLLGGVIPVQGNATEIIQAYTNVQTFGLTDPAIIRAMAAGYSDAMQENEQLFQSWKNHKCVSSSAGAAESCAALTTYKQLGGTKEDEVALLSRTMHNIGAVVGEAVGVSLKKGNIKEGELLALLRNSSKYKLSWWNDAATMKLAASEQQLQQRMELRLAKSIEEAAQKEPFSQAQKDKIKLEAEARKQKQEQLNVEAQKQLEHKYAESLSPEGKQKFKSDHVERRTETCEHSLKTMSCSDSTKKNPNEGNVVVGGGGSGGNSGGNPNPGKPDPGGNPGGPDPSKPDPNKPDPNVPKEQDDVIELHSTEQKLTPNQSFTVNTILKRFKTALQVGAVELTVDVTGAKVDTSKLQANPWDYRHGGGKFIIAKHAADYAGSNSVDQIVTTNQRVTYRLMVTQSGDVTLKSDDQLLSIPFVADSSFNEVIVTITNVQLYDGNGNAIMFNKPKEPLKIPLKP
ncbi:FecR domain-containing protein [Paenibacillus sp. 481]|uniref:FecR domain-containing protein n=1 Tax=Paenibacillus sp. 481 TaxID=2835869 RepID=UPI001E44BA30|nr:FecR domain-containing protein [Paenibacillus sp. 481]UHA72617.1 FecR domain-containing protein [Paenibacillus sp. 481]